MTNFDQHIVVDPQIYGGAPYFRQSRIPVYLIVGFVESGVPVTEILEIYPSLSLELIDIALAYAAAHRRDE